MLGTADERMLVRVVVRARAPVRMWVRVEERAVREEREERVVVGLEEEVEVRVLGCWVVCVCRGR